MKPILEVRNISKKYSINKSGNPGYLSLRDNLSNIFKTQHSSDKEDFWALKDASFEVNPGDSVGIIGRNGAGKSTLLKILSKITPPTSGKIISRGRIASLLEVGTGFHQELTGRENIYLNGSILGLKRNEISKQFDSIVEFSGVEKFLDTPLKHYSSGMQLRLAFAVAAHLEPEILIIDEVLAVGDSEFQKRCIGKMEEVSKSGRTILFVSHNMAAVQSLCNKGIFLQNGMVQSVGSIKDTVERYLRVKSSNADSNFNPANRRGNGIIRFTNISFLDKTNKKVDTLITGEEFKIVIDYKCTTSIKPSNLIVSIAISRNDEIQLTDLSSESVGKKFTNLSNEGQLACTIKKLPLVSGKYYLNIFSSFNGEICDWIINASSIEIEQGDFYNTGKNKDKEQCIFLMDYSWDDSLI